MKIPIPWRERPLGIQQMGLEADAPLIFRETMAWGHSLSQFGMLLLIYDRGPLATGIKVGIFLGDGTKR